MFCQMLREEKGQIEIMIAGKTVVNKGCLPEQFHQLVLCPEACLLPAQPCVYQFQGMSLLVSDKQHSASACTRGDSCPEQL